MHGKGIYVNLLGELNALESGGASGWLTFDAGGAIAPFSPPVLTPLSLIQPISI